MLVGQQDHDHVSGFDSVVDFHHGQTGFADFVPRCTAFAQTDDHFDAAVVQVLGVCVALRAITNEWQRSCP